MAGFANCPFGLLFAENAGQTMGELQRGDRKGEKGTGKDKTPARKASQTFS